MLHLKENETQICISNQIQPVPIFIVVINPDSVVERNLFI